MSYVRAMRGLFRADALRVARDRFLVGAAVYLFATGAAMRWVLPAVTAGVRRRWQVDLEPYFPLITSYFVIGLGAMAVGVVGGFILLELREERSIVALRVSPFPLRLYVAGFSLIIALVGAGVALAEAAIIGLGLPPWNMLPAIALVGGSGASVVAMYLGAFPSNKVEAFAHMKFVSVVAAVPLGAYFLPGSWQYLACLAPPFWTMKAWWVAEAGGGSWPVWTVGGGLTTMGLVTFFSSRFQAAGSASSGS